MEEMYVGRLAAMEERVRAVERRQDALNGQIARFAAANEKLIDDMGADRERSQDQRNKMWAAINAVRIEVARLNVKVGLAAAVGSLAGGAIVATVLKATFNS